MDEEKFDQNLKEKIQKFDSEYSPVFNEDKIWKGINKGQLRINWILIAAASVVLILGFSILFQQSNEFLDMAKKQKPAKNSIKTIELPQSKARIFEIVKNKSEEQKSDTSIPKPPIKEVLNNINQSIVAIAVLDNIIQKIDSVQAGPVKMEDPVIVKKEPPLVKDLESDIKVKFKRGNPVNIGIPPDNKVVFKRFKIRIFEVKTNDTPAYASGVEVEAEKKFRIKL
jgi:hypothetical protein